MDVVLSDFARRRLFDPARPTLVGCTAEEFERHLCEHAPRRRLPGYAPFCELWVYPNWTPTPVGAVEITPDNAHLLRSAYEARTPEELPVLTRWFEGVQPPRARYLLPIVYDREQMAREGEAIEAAWAVVGCLATAEPREVPMTPITIMRNALGVDEGGSGVPLNRQAYLASVAFWSRHADCRPVAGES